VRIKLAVVSGVPTGVLACDGDRHPVDAHLPRFHSGIASSAGNRKTGFSFVISAAKHLASFQPL